MSCKTSYGYFACRVLRGYAIADVSDDSSQEETVLHVHLICSERGSGYALFQSMVEYGRTQHLDSIEIEPMNEELEALYIEWGARSDVEFRQGELSLFGSL